MPLALCVLVLYAHVASRPPPDGGPLCNDGTCKIVQLSSGGDFTCGLTDSGHVKCWGGNDLGQLGRDADRRINYAGSVLGLNDTVVSIGGNRYRGCAVLRTGRVKCWGGGDGPQPRLVTTPEGVVAASQGYHHACVLTEDGRVSCWGSDDDEPLTEVLAGEVVQVSAGGSHSCVLTKTGAVKCWGSNDSGQLGDGTTSDSAVPVDVEGLPGEAISITMGGEHSCALLRDGRAMCWGSNEFGQLGHEIRAPRTEPIDIGGLSMLSAGVDHTCGLTPGGEVYCWGRNDHAQVGDDTTQSARSPTPVRALGTSAVSVEAGHRHSCAIMDSGGVQCWGMVEGSGSRLRRSPEWVVSE
jgi:alpha-tubulin suppressor-like RCC1 family protein